MIEKLNGEVGRLRESKIIKGNVIEFIYYKDAHKYLVCVCVREEKTEKRGRGKERKQINSKCTEDGGGERECIV